MPDAQPTNISPTTTSEQDRHSAGQRWTNKTWELTQSAIAVAVTGAFIYAKLAGIDAPALDNTFFMVAGFYFGRTNHQRVGGVELGR